MTVPPEAYEAAWERFAHGFLEGNTPWDGRQEVEATVDAAAPFIVERAQREERERIVGS